MRDPDEGVTREGTIRTGASRRAIPRDHDGVLRASADAVEGRCSLYVYGSVATGTAVVPTSDVDLLAIGLAADEATRLSTELTTRFQTICREVSIGPASWEALWDDGDEGYGLRVFLRHYCVHLVGVDPAGGLPEFPADERAARGFNGDIARHVARWRAALDDGADVARLGVRIARKTLLAVAGLVSMREAIWSTDRRTCAARWGELEPESPVDELVRWLDTPPRDPTVVERALNGPVAAVVRAFESEIGLWRD